MAAAVTSAEWGLSLGCGGETEEKGRVRKSTTNSNNNKMYLQRLRLLLLLLLLLGGRGCRGVISVVVVVEGLQ